MKRVIRPGFEVGPYDIIVGALPTGPCSPVTIDVPEVPDAIANLAAAGLNPQIIHYEQEDSTPW